MKSALALVTVLFPLFALSSEIKPGEGSCGSLGCDAVTTSPAQVLSAALLDQDLAKIVGMEQIQSITKDPKFLYERYQLKTSSRVICLAVDYLELPMVIDGKSTITVGDYNILISTQEGACK